MAIKMATTIASLNGVKNGDATSMATIEEPSGSCEVSGPDSLLNNQLAKGASPRKIRITATTTRNRRSRSSIRCEMKGCSSPLSGGAWLSVCVM